MATTEQKSALERLADIWGRWSMGQRLAPEEGRTQRAALQGLIAALEAGGASLAARSVQALLVDPERPDASGRPLFEPLWRAVRDQWEIAGTGNPNDVLRLQALILAAWSEQPQNVTLRRIPSLVSPWRHINGRTAQRPTLEQWLYDCQHDEHSDHRSVGAVAQSAVPTELATPQTDHAAEVNGLPADTHARRRMYHSQELLWWGQALYCYSLRCPFRRIKDPDEATWYAALEAASRASELPVEPAASYLQEVLRTMGIAVDEKRSVWQHAQALRDVLQRPRVRRDSLPQELRQLVREDAFGLPISRLCIEPGVADDVLRDSLGVEADATSIDRGEWAAWVFRELMLQMRWPAPEPTP